MQLRIERRMVPHIPWGLVGAALLIAVLGIWNLASASRPPHTPLWTRQSINLGVGPFAALDGVPGGLPGHPAMGAPPSMEATSLRAAAPSRARAQGEGRRELVCHWAGAR